ncbi:MAG TPA: cytochrome c biogenesis protein ResB [Candidatus Acidoferrum sp.]|nr:cytochrome c biogenesis protein ResB [Candidatus Acidoferrum sp.]
MTKTESTIEAEKPKGSSNPASASPGPGRQLFNFFTSLRLTVVFLFLAVLLVFIGTLAQVEEGLYAAQHRYFRSLFIWWQPGGGPFKLPVFPGGYLIGGVLLVNLICAYTKRFQLSKKKIGLLTIHSGLVLLLVGQFATDLLQVESAMQLFEGDTKGYSEDFRANELVLIDKSSSAEKDRVYSVPDSLLKHHGDIRDAQLPFTLRVKTLWENAGLVEPGTNNPPMAIPSGATAGTLRDILVIPMPLVKDMDSRNMPGGLIEVLDGDTSLGSFLVSSLLSKPESFSVKGKQYEIGMRFKRYYYPFNITLLKATHETYKGRPDIPKNFASRVRVEYPAKKEARETVIYMNNPLRYEGLTFFQYQMSAGDFADRQGQKPSSTFQVVRNPSWLTPYLSCVIIATGLIIQFMMHLVGFVRKRNA